MAAKKKDSFLADPLLHKMITDESTGLLASLQGNGWTNEIVTSGRYDTKRFGALTKTVPNPCDKEGNVINDEKNSTRSEAAVTSPYGSPESPRDSDCSDDPDSSPSASLNSIASINLMRGDGDPSAVVALDTEYYEDGEGCRRILTWQLALSNPFTGMVELAVVYPLTNQRVRLNDVLAWVVERYGLAGLEWCRFEDGGIPYKDTRRWYVPATDESGKKVEKCFPTQQEAIDGTCDEEVREYLSGKEYDVKQRVSSETGDYVHPAGYVNEFRDFRKQALPVTILSHAGKADLTTFHASCRYDIDILPRLSEVQGGLVSSREIHVNPYSLKDYRKFYPIGLTLRDTMCFAPDGKKSLADLGHAIGVPKLEVADHDKSHMDGFLVREPLAFLDYAVNDSLITLCYAGSLWGYNRLMRITVTSAAAKVALETLRCYFPYSVNQQYRGLKQVTKGLAKRSDNKPGYIADRCLEPVSPMAEMVQRVFTNSYHGGWNGSSAVGWYEGVTHDYDLMNAYPTAMCQVIDLDWNPKAGELIEGSWEVGESITLDDFILGPFTPIAGFFSYEFPEGVAYPTLPTNVEGCLVYTRTSEGADGTYACGPELYVALKLGAKVTVGKGGVAYRAKALMDSEGKPSRCLSQVVGQFVADRSKAQELFGKKSLADLLLKTAVNSLYGKTAQSVVDKTTWNAYRDEMENLGGSAITSPYHAAMITSGVRALLLASMNQLTDAGFICHSVTTDGFITDAPFNELGSLDLLGLRDGFAQARVELSDEPAIWSEKHRQTGLLNLSTRANVALNAEATVDGFKGVCAHNSLVTGHPKDSYEDRLSFAISCLSRTGRVICQNKKFAGFRQLAARTGRRDFRVEDIERAIAMDFDLKRKPDRGSFVTVRPVIEGNAYEIANFSTVPYETVEEYKLCKFIGRDIARKGCLRTEDDWEQFWHRVSKKSNGTRMGSGDREFDVLISCVRGHRYHGEKWNIPFLSSDRSVLEKIRFVNSFNRSSREFKKGDWDNALRKSRQGSILPFDECEPLIIEMREESERIAAEEEAAARLRKAEDKAREAGIEAEAGVDAETRVEADGEVENDAEADAEIDPEAAEPSPDPSEGG